MESFKIGMEATYSKVFTGEDVVIFSELSGDVNPVHLDEGFASRSIFGRRIVHGFLFSSLISTVIANKLPGPGSVYLNQELNFKKPVFWGEKVTAKVRIIRIREEKNILFLKTDCINESNEIVVEGSAVIKMV